MSRLLSALSFFVVLAVSVNGHTYHTGGNCPTVEPMSGFTMKQFLGTWYAIQKTSTASTCVIYNITLGDEPGEYKVEQLSQHFALGLTPLKHEYSYTGQITIPDNDVPAKMKVKFPLNVAGSSTFIVFMTDYENYAGIFTCQKLGFVHRRSATILSRTHDLDRAYVDKIRNRLSSYGVSPFDLSVINQTGCPTNGSAGVNIHIDDETFSTQSIADVFRKAGEKIGDGVEYAVGAGKKIYNSLSKDRSGNLNVANDDREHDAVVIPLREPDAEWVRV